ncbi:MAG: energy-coupling factor transporter transmembrane component T [Candidatus Cohnella colombiensis]|uniref:Energy-coupling factor transporter transmembrane component T n=1 Tax=Candidatus Cohnella colombiensis TaxID=3121368 RepID=A0AA95JFK3_9BACL|nr:MAG: energy-coupling factor transporter transmembrane component T [Cohnella sp.]
MIKEGFGFRSLHPIVLIAYYAGGITFGMLLFHPLILLSGWVAMMIVNVQLDRGREWRRWSIPMLVGFILITIMNPILSHRGRTVLHYWGDIPITLESVVYGITLALSVVSLLTLFVSYRIVVSEQKFLYLFSRISPKAALIAMMTLGLVPRLRRRLHELILIQRTRGITVTDGTIVQRAKNGTKFVVTLLSWTLEDALQTADSMQARGYGTKVRSSYLGFRFRSRDGWMLGGLSIIALLIVFTWVNGHGFLAIYPKFKSIKLTPEDIVAQVGYVGFLILPLVLEWRDRLAWRILKSSN